MKKTLLLILTFFLIPLSHAKQIAEGNIPINGKVLKANLFDDPAISPDCKARHSNAMQAMFYLNGESFAHGCWIPLNGEIHTQITRYDTNETRAYVFAASVFNKTNSLEEKEQNNNDASTRKSESSSIENTRKSDSRSPTENLGSIRTRYGDIFLDKNGRLTFNGKTINQHVYYGSASEALVARFKVGKSDIMLFLQEKGNSCPGNYIYVTIKEKVATATKNFGTCNEDEVRPYLEGKSIIFSMTNLGGNGSTI